MKYGCTCGQCAGGFFSPRMNLALFCLATMFFKILDPDIDSPMWTRRVRDITRHLPHDARQRLAKSKPMRQGLIDMYGCVAFCLLNDELPTEKNVLHTRLHAIKSSKRLMNRYLKGGGTVRAVVMSLFEASKAWSSAAGDGRFDEICKDRIDEIPECRNDHEYGFVSAMCGFEGTYLIQEDWWP